LKQPFHYNLVNFLNALPVVTKIATAPYSAVLYATSSYWLLCSTLS